MKTIETDLFVIGGGINGTGIALDAIGRGLKVTLCESHNLGAATSSKSSKLVHGGLRYLEMYEFKLVREALKEREVLLNKAPHLIQPLTFVLPHQKHLRPTWMIKCGMFLYDFLAGKMQLKKSKKVSLKNTIYGENLKDDLKVGFSYSDCRIDDSRMVILNSLDAQLKGANILVRTKFVKAQRNLNKKIWESIVEDENGNQTKIHSKAIINAAGPWVADILHNGLENNSKSKVNLVKGSHIVVPKLYKGTHAYILQNKDNRIIFAIPYGFTSPENNEFTLIGTTDLRVSGDVRDIEISKEETEYLCKLINEYFKKGIKKEDIIWDYAGVRPLYDDGSDNPSKITREYHFELEDKNGILPVLSIFGGKITTFRTLSEKALERVEKYFDKKIMSKTWTKYQKTLGGNCLNQKELILKLEKDYPLLDKKLIYRFAVSYGDLTYKVLKKASKMEDLGDNFGHNLYEVEVKYLLKNEWVRTVNDIIWINSKLGLWLNENDINKLEKYLETYFKK